MRPYFPLLKVRAIFVVESLESAVEPARRVDFAVGQVETALTIALRG
jgi:hypothetical protein